MWPGIKAMVEDWEADEAEQIWEAYKLAQYNTKDLYYLIEKDVQK